jgi:hypothetical protein
MASACIGTHEAGPDGHLSYGRTLPAAGRVSEASAGDLTHAGRMDINPRLNKLVALAAAAVGALALGAPAASAGVLVKSAPSCEGQPLSKPFAPWRDQANYTLAPGGAFEPGDAGWKLTRASVVAGNERFQVRDEGDAHSLRIGPGGSATSPTICVGLEHPTLRFFARSDGNLLQPLTLEVITETSVGLTLAVPVGVVLPSDAWKPTARQLVVANMLPLLPRHHTPVAFRVRSVGGATWWIDDFYVDPKRRA